MITTDVDAYNEMCERARDVLASTAVAQLVGYSPELRYPDRNYPELPSALKVWARISLAEAGALKRTLSRPSRVTQTGIVDIQLFVPVGNQRTSIVSVTLGQLVRLGVFATSTPSVDFSHAVSRSMGKEDKWFYRRVSATYKYDTLE